MISLTGQYAAVDENQTGRENLVMVGRLMHLGKPAARRRTAELLEQFGLTDAMDRRVKTYSGGMRRRLDLAMSLIARPRVIFLDEPTTGLDPASRSTMWDAIGDLVRDGTTILLTTQYLEEADRPADRIVLLDHGRIVATGTADALKAQLGGERIELHFASEPELLKATGVLDGIAGPDVLSIPSDGTAAHLHHVLDVLRDNGLQPQRVSSHRPTLDDVFRAPDRLEVAMSHQGMGAAFSDAVTMMDRSVRLARRNVDTLFVSILMPLLMMALFVYVFGGAINTGTEYINYVVPGILLLTTGYGAASTAMVVADDMSTGMIDRLRSLPIRSFAVLTGHVTGSFARNAASTTIVILASLAMGFRPVGSAVDWLATIGLLLLYVLALSWLAAGLGVIAKSVESASTLSFFMLFLPYLSSAFVRPESMPSWLRPISEHQPITPVIETVRSLLIGTPLRNNGWIALAWCCGLLLFSITLATWLYRERTSR